MRLIRNPYHVDDYLPGLDLPLPASEVATGEVPAGDVWERLGVLYSGVAAAVAGMAGKGSPPVVVSGDCTTSLGTVAGLQRAGLDVGIVWLDAHGDVQTLETTASGYLGGLPLRLLVGYRPELIARRLGLRPVAEYQVILAGARDLDPPEVTYLAESQIGRCEVADLGTAELPDGPLYLHVDLDVIDSAYLPGLRYPAPGGPGPAEVATAMSNVLGTGRVAAVGIGCTWHPGHGNAELVSPWLTAALGGDADRGRSG
jgi:arginase